MGLDRQEFGVLGPAKFPKSREVWIMDFPKGINLVARSHCRMGGGKLADAVDGEYGGFRKG